MDLPIACHDTPSSMLGNALVLPALAMQIRDVLPSLCCNESTEDN